MRIHAALALLVLIVTPSRALAQPPASTEKPLDPALAKDIDRLLELTGVFKLGHQVSSAVTQQALQGLRASNPNVPVRATEIIREMIGAEFDKAYEPDGPLAQQVKQAYARHFTRQDIRGLLTFYESPLGKKFLQTLPAVSQETMEIGMQWARGRMPGLMQEIQARLKKEGIAK
jgi:hypothetical protein